MGWKSELNYQRGNTYDTLKQRAIARLNRLSQIGGPTASQRARSILRALAAAKSEYAAGTVGRSAPRPAPRPSWSSSAWSSFSWGLGRR